MLYLPVKIIIASCVRMQAPSCVSWLSITHTHTQHICPWPLLVTQVQPFTMAGLPLISVAPRKLPCWLLWLCEHLPALGYLGLLAIHIFHSWQCSFRKVLACVKIDTWLQPCPCCVCVCVEVTRVRGRA